MLLREAAVALCLLGGVATARPAVSFEVPRSEPPADNAFDYYQRAFGLLPRDAPWGRYTVGELDPAEVGTVEQSLAGAQAALAELRRGIGKPCALPPSTGPEPDFRPLARFREVTRLLVLEGWVHEQQGDWRAALNSYMDAMVLGQDAARNGSIIPKLISIACEAMACKAVRQWAGHAPWEEALFADLLARLEGFEAREVPLSQVFALEYAEDRALLEGGFSEAEARGGHGSRPKGLRALLDRLGRDYSAAAAVADSDYWRTPAQWSERPRRGAADDPFPGRAAVLALAREKHAVHLANVRGTLLVVALELHWVRHLRYPDQLSELAPGTLAKLPVDPFSGQGFRYRSVDRHAYTLYSVGPDLRDDGRLRARGGHGEKGDLIFSPWR